MESSPTVPQYLCASCFPQNPAVGVMILREGHQKLRSPGLLDRMRNIIRAHHYSPRTEKTYVIWARCFILFHNKRHPAEMGASEVNSFLTHLAVKGKVSSSTQNQALSALLFLYRHVLGKEIGELGEVIRARRPHRLPVVMTREEARTVLGRLKGEKWLMASLLYGADCA